MAIFLRHEGCPRCGSSDAHAIYDDGGTHCFSCGFSNRASVPSFREETNEYDEDSIVLPHDLSRDFPQEVVEWITPTGVKIEELIAHGYFFSKSAGGLVRVLNAGQGGGVRRGVRENASAYENRFLFNRSKASQKCKFFGSKEQVYAYSYRGQPYNPLQSPSAEGGLPSRVGQGQEVNWNVYACNTGRLVIVEDSLSSIKTGRVIPSAPLFGSSISNNKLVNLIRPFDEAIVWLDSNKLNSARLIADRIKMLGKKSRVIYTELDPKYCNAEEWI